jgi:hypothetical protein
VLLLVYLFVGTRSFFERMGNRPRQDTIESTIATAMTAPRNFGTIKESAGSFRAATILRIIRISCSAERV